MPYVNYYPVNGALIVPMLGGPEDEAALPILEKAASGAHDRSGTLDRDGGGRGRRRLRNPATTSG